MLVEGEGGGTVDIGGDADAHRGVGVEPVGHEVEEVAGDAVAAVGGPDVEILDLASAVMASGEVAGDVADDLFAIHRDEAYARGECSLRMVAEFKISEHARIGGSGSGVGTAGSSHGGDIVRSGVSERDRQIGRHPTFKIPLARVLGSPVEQVIFCTLEDRPCRNHCPAGSCFRGR